MSNTLHKCAGCGVEVYFSVLGGLKVEYAGGTVHMCQGTRSKLSVVPPPVEEEPPQKGYEQPAKKKG